jgi:regulator of protease activity HflC (stomatin/prohibitin superfamily)
MAVPEALQKAAGLTVCAIIVFGIISIITVLASIKTLGPEDQVVVHYLDGKETVDGPCTKVFNPFREKTERKAIKVGNLEYIRIKDSLNGGVRMVAGHAKVFLGAYEEIDGLEEKIVVKKDEYIRLVDRVSGVERVVKGAASIVPGAWEVSNEGVQQASFVNQETAIVILNKADGTKRLYTTAGPYFPDPYEVVAGTTERIRVLPHETMVVRDAFGRYIIHSGAGEKGKGTGTSFFLEPFEEIVEMDWSTFSEPPEGDLQIVGTQRVSRIDMRARKVFYQYDVRTNDNVALRVEGTIFWQIDDVSKLINTTADPAGDVWYKARSALISAVSQVDLETFMSSFNPLIQAAFLDQAGDIFYSRRGVELKSMEVTKYDCTDEETKATLQEIIEETTNRINKLQAQKSENDVKTAKLAADIYLEQQRTELLKTQSANQQKEAELNGAAEGTQLAKSAVTFLEDLNVSLPSLDQRLELYKMHKQLENQNTRTKFIAGGKSTLFMTPADMNLNMNIQEL